MYLHKNDSHTWKRRGEKYVQVFFKKGGYKKRVGAFFLLCRVQLLPPLCVNLTIVCFQLPADVTLNKMFKAVIALSEQILQVPIPWLGVLKHTHRNMSGQIADIWRFVWSKMSLLIYETWLMNIKLHLNFIINAGKWKGTSHTFMELRSMSFFPGQHWWKENINIYRQPAFANLTGSLLDDAVGPNQKIKKVRILLNLMKNPISRCTH